MPQFSPLKSRENTSSSLLWGWDMISHVKCLEQCLAQSKLSSRPRILHGDDHNALTVVPTESGKSIGLGVRRSDLNFNCATEQAVWSWANPVPLWVLISSPAPGFLISQVLPYFGGKGKTHPCQSLLSPSGLALGPGSFCSNDIPCPPWIWRVSSHPTGRFLLDCPLARSRFTRHCQSRVHPIISIASSLHYPSSRRGILV